jgi:hypothetical protein
MAKPSPALRGCLAAFLVASCAASCRPASGRLDILQAAPRESLLAGAGLDGTIPNVPVGQDRLDVLFTPDFNHCTPETMRISRALRRVAKDYPDIRVFTLRPASVGNAQTAYGERRPGEMLTISDAAYKARDAVAPNPRLEVWTGERERRLLLMRSLPRVVTEDEIYAEVLWARSFTGAPSTAGS